MQAMSSHVLRALPSLSSRSVPRPSQIRMSSSTPAREITFLVVIPDKPGVHAKRLEVRQTHFKDLQANLAANNRQNIRAGGALLHSVPEGEDPAQWDFAGSTIIRKASSKEEVLEDLKKDIYTTSGVWDLEKVQIYPFNVAIWQS